MIKLTIPGEPVAKGRPRFNSKTGIAYTPKKTKGFETLIKEIAYNEIDEPIEGPVSMELIFCFQRPKNKLWKTKPMPRLWKSTRPDWDNLAKSVCDALNGIAYRDDGQVVEIYLAKVVCAGKEKPHTEVIIKKLEGGPEDEEDDS